MVYGIDLPNDSESADLVKRFLESLAIRFDDPAVAVDKGVWNAARISKIYGTLSMKGDSTPTRPHRISRNIKTPDVLETVPVELLRKVAEERMKTISVPTPKKATTPGTHLPDDVERMMNDRGMAERH